jgi:electron transport complex protein RnfG
VKKDGGEFDEFTGATITPRAVVASVYNALAFFEQHRDELLDPDLNPARLAARGTSNGN